MLPDNTLKSGFGGCLFRGKLLEHVQCNHVLHTSMTIVNLIEHNLVQETKFTLEPH